MSSRIRFSLLLLEPGEIYFEDISVYCYPAEVPENDAILRRRKGRLKICSKSIIFDPDEFCEPILKFPLTEIDQIEEWAGTLLSTIDSNGPALFISSLVVVKMLEGNIIAPYNICRENVKFIFTLNYGTTRVILPQISQLKRASTLSVAEQSTMIAAIVKSRQSRVKFDPCWLEDLHEQIILESQCNRITPLVTNPGRILLTDRKLYYQPFNNAEPQPVIKIKLKDIKRVLKRRFLLRHVGLELFCGEYSPTPHLFVSMKSELERDRFYSSLLAQPLLKLEDEKQESMMLLWQNRVISNYDYLVYLNSISDRSTNDLTQYPVFPWVISDYKQPELDLEDESIYRDLSKPIGALNEDRLQKLKERFDEMPEPKFLYGSHYSTPGFVLYYLVRKMPQYVLCLHGGRFDHPDRMFNSIAHTWRNVLTNTADFKELIPEFYDISGHGDLFVNQRNIDFGLRQENQRVEDVEMPPWAEGPEDFVNKLSMALESEYVSDNLHNWIDLMFGYKQRGKEALQANNVFYHLTYEGAIDLDNIIDLNEKHALELQIMEFGQVPKQVFMLPHPQRRSSLHPVCSPSTSTFSQAEDTSTTPNSEELPQILSSQKRIKFTQQHKHHKKAVSDVCFSRDNKYYFSVSLDTAIKVYDVSNHEIQRSANISHLASSACVPLPDPNRVLIGSWDNSIYVYSVEYGKVVASILAHDDAVSDLCWDNGLMVTASWDSTVKLWNYDGVGNNRSNFVLQGELDHETLVCCVALREDHCMTVSGLKDGQLYAWDNTTCSLLLQEQIELSPINVLSFSPDSRQIISCSKSLRIADLATGTVVYSKKLDEECRSLCWDGNSILLGTTTGKILVWDLLTAQVLTSTDAHNGIVTSINISEDRSCIITGCSDGSVKLWSSRIPSDLVEISKT